MPTQQVPERLRALDHRTRWARLRAPVWVVAGAVVAGASAAAAVLVLLGLVAWSWSRLFRRKLADVPVWGVVDEALVAAGALVALVLVATIVGYGLFGAPRHLLRALGGEPADAASPGERRALNVLDELAIGLGIAAPPLVVLADESPNALSVRRWNDRTIVVTSGLLELPRDEIEAVLAHELAHLYAFDSRWTTAAESSLARSHQIAGVVALIGALLVAGGYYLDLIWSMMIAGGVMLGVGIAGGRVVGSLLPRIRAESDELADVAAIRLARHPAALGEVCARLAADTTTVRATPNAARLLWFELRPDDEISPQRAADELRRRAAAAYSEARLPGLAPPSR